MELADLNINIARFDIDTLINETRKLNDEVSKLQSADDTMQANENDFFLLIMACCIFCA
jgi:hypothetical protein